jgi:hypothetical protein
MGSIELGDTLVLMVLRSDVLVLVLVVGCQGD